MKKIFSKSLLAIVSIATIIIGVFYFKKKNDLLDRTANDLNNKDSITAIVPPLPSNDNPFVLFEVNTARDTNIIFKTGSIISIPKGAFVDENGDLLIGNVSIKYKEYHSLSEILLSGINMKYDSAGVEQYFESAGMFEINGSQNNKEVFIRKETPVQVAMTSFNNVDGEFSQYQLNKATNKWDYIKQDEPQVVSIADSIEKEKDLRKKLNLVKPIPIHTFSLKGDEFPHLKEYKDIIFKVSDKTKNYYEYEKCMTNVKVQTTKIKGEYRIVFYSFKDSIEVYATNFSDSKEFEKRISAYESAAKALADRLGIKYKEIANQFASKLDMYLNAMGQYDKSRIIYMDLMSEKENLTKEEKKTLANDAYYNDKIINRVFTVMNFGIYNSDKARSVPNVRTIEVAFSEVNGKQIPYKKAYLIEKGSNVIYYIYNNKISYDPAKENVIIVVTQGNGIASVKSKIFDKVASSQSKANFVLDVKTSKFYTAMDINDMIIN